MKKTIILIVTALLLCTSLSAKENLFSFSAGLTSGVPIYGSNSVVSGLTLTNSSISDVDEVVVVSSISGPSVGSSSPT